MTSIASKAHARLVRYRVENLERLQGMIRQALITERNQINGRLNAGEETDVEQLDSMRDELVMIGEMNDMADQLAFVGLYSLVELRLKALLESNIEALVNNHHITRGDAKLVYKIEVLKPVLKDHFTPSIDLPLVKNFQAIDEIRLINNSVKHNGVVSAKLAGSFPVWKQGRPLSGLARAFNRLSPKIAPFIEDLAKKLPTPPPVPLRSRTLP